MHQFMAPFILLDITTATMWPCCVVVVSLQLARCGWLISFIHVVLCIWSNLFHRQSTTFCHSVATITTSVYIHFLSISLICILTLVSPQWNGFVYHGKLERSRTHFRISSAGGIPLWQKQHTSKDNDYRLFTVFSCAVMMHNIISHVDMCLATV